MAHLYSGLTFIDRAGENGSGERVSILEQRSHRARADLSDHKKE